MCLIGSTVFLASCQTSNTYMKIADGPDVEYSLAKCEIASASTEQGVFAMGSPGYVFGAQLGNAIGNEIRKQEFVKRCMIMHGWKQVPRGAPAKSQPSPVSSSLKAYKPKSVPSFYGTRAITPPSGGMVAGG